MDADITQNQLEYDPWYWISFVLPPIGEKASAKEESNGLRMVSREMARIIAERIDFIDAWDAYCRELFDPDRREQHEQGEPLPPEVYIDGRLIVDVVIDLLPNDARELVRRKRKS